MARPRTPTATLELNGAFKKNPGRRRKNEPLPSGPLGAPPKHLSDKQREAWLELDSIAPARVLMNADRWLVEIACRIMSAMREHGIGGKYGISVGELAQLNQCLSRMGLTPADRSKIAVGEEKDEQNPFANLDNEGKDVRPN